MAPPDGKKLKCWGKGAWQPLGTTTTHPSFSDWGIFEMPSLHSPQLLAHFGCSSCKLEAEWLSYYSPACLPSLQRPQNLATPTMYLPAVVPGCLLGSGLLAMPCPDPRCIPLSEPWLFERWVLGKSSTVDSRSRSSLESYFLKTINLRLRCEELRWWGVLRKGI